MAELFLPGDDKPIMAVEHRFHDVPVVVHPSPFSVETRAVKVPHGATVTEIVTLSGLPENSHGFVRVFVDDTEIARAMWHLVRPRVGRHVYIRVTPMGKNGKSLLSSLLMMAVVVAGSVFAPMLTTALMPGLTGTALSIATSLVGAGISLVGAMLISALIPPPTNTDIATQRQLLSGVRNRFAPYATIPRHYGKRRVYPLQAARPYTEAQGKDRYLRVLLAVGFGPLKVSEIKIGDTPIDAYEAIRYQVREGWHADHAQFGSFPAGKSPDAAQTLFTKTVIEESFNVLLDDGGEAAGEWAERVTDPDTSEISVDVTFPLGLAKFKDNGGTDDTTIEVEVEYRAAGSSDPWTPVVWDGNDEEDGTEVDGKLTCKDNSASPTTRGGRWVCPNPGQWAVRLRRTTPLKTPNSKYVQRTEWTALRSIKQENPVDQPGMTLIAIRMKATDQLNGIPDTINCVVESYVPQFNGTSWTWALGSNPAWAYADMMRRRGTTRVIADSRIALAGIRSWATDCDATAPNADEPRWTFNGTLEGGAIHTALRLIASHGRASFAIRDGRYGVTQDKPQTVPVQHITPRNSFGYSGSKAFVDLPHALKVQFINAENGFQEDEVIVYDDGYSAANATKFESIELPGCTSPTMAWREGRYYLAVGQLRPEEHVVSMDIENLRCTLGDYVLFAHDVLNIGVAYARIASRVMGRNLLNWTEDFSNSVWQGYWQKPLMVFGDPAPDGSATAWSWNPLNTTGSPSGQTGGLLFPAPAGDAGKTVTVSVWLKASAATTVTLGVSDGNTTTVNLTTSWQRFTYTGIVNPAGTRYFQIFDNTSANVNVYLWHPQAEYGSVATDYQANNSGTSLNGLVVGLELDTEVPRETGTKYVARVRRVDGTSQLLPLVLNTGAQDTTTEVIFDTPLATGAAPQAGDLVMYGEMGLEAAPMMVKRIEPGPNLTAKLTLVDAQPGVWTADTGRIPDFKTYVSETDPVRLKRPEAPTFTLVSNENQLERKPDGTLQERIAVTVGVMKSDIIPATHFEVQYRRRGSSDWLQAVTSRVAIKKVYIAPVQQGDAYDVRVRAISQYGIDSPWTTELGHVVVGKTTPPADVQGFTAEGRIDGAQLSWWQNTEIDVVAYTIKRGKSWDTAELVTSKLRGTSLFVAIDTSVEQTFLIRAVDAIGLLSETPASVKVSVTLPGDVEAFTAYPQDDAIRFKWAKVDGNSIRYEIRAGAAWSTGQRVAQVAGNTATVRLPARLAGLKTFWIKALSPAGLYSATARYTTLNQNPIVNRNIVLEDDFSASNWPGVLVNMTKIGSGVTSYLTVNKAADKLTMRRSDYYRTISLPASFYARNWLELQLSATVDNSTTWADATMSWDEAGNIAWTGTLADSAGCNITPYIAVADASATPADLIEEFRLDNSTTGSNGTTPASATGIVYGTLHVGRGVEIDEITSISYNLTLPDSFTAMWDFRFRGDRGSYTPFLVGVLADPYTDPGNAASQSGNFLLMRFSDGTNTLQVQYIASTGSFRVIGTGTGQGYFEVPVAFETGDLLSFGLSQTATQRRLVIHNHRTGVTKSGFEAFAPVGTLTSFRPHNPGLIAAPGTLGNIEFRSNAMSIATLKDLLPVRTPAGYQEFRELVPGDYEYQNAIIWIAIDCDDRSLDLALAEVVLSVDVPDLVQKGSASLTTIAQAITFATPYTTTPVLQVTQTGGTTLALARVTNLTATGFTVQLFNASAPATAVAGTVSYTATGY